MITINNHKPIAKLRDNPKQAFVYGDKVYILLSTYDHTDPNRGDKLPYFSLTDRQIVLFHPVTVITPVDLEIDVI